MARQKTAVQRGDKFIKVDNPEIVWEVEGPVDHLEMEPHVRLTQIGRPKRKLTLAVSVLLDSNFHRRV